MAATSHPRPLPQRLDDLEGRVAALEARLDGRADAPADVADEASREISEDAPSEASAAFPAAEQSSEMTRSTRPEGARDGDQQAVGTTHLREAGASLTIDPHAGQALPFRSAESAGEAGEAADVSEAGADATDEHRCGSGPAELQASDRRELVRRLAAGSRLTSPSAGTSAVSSPAVCAESAPDASAQASDGLSSSATCSSPVAALSPAPTAAARPRRTASSWELLIGGKWAAGLGAIAVVIAVAYFVKYAYDEGLFRLLSNTTKCLITAGFGALLIVAGEIVLRKVNRWAATGLFAAGITTLYLTAYASCKYFGLVSETGSLVLLSLVALIGVGITIRGNLLFVGALSIVGGFVNPLLFPDTNTAPVAFPLYLSMVFAVSLALSAFRPAVFRPLRYVGCVGIGVLGALWSLSAGTATPWTMVLAFLSIWWALAIAESLLAATREQSPIGNVIVSLIATTWTILLGTVAIASAPAPAAGFDWTGLYMLAVGLIAAALAFQFGAGLEGLKGVGETALSRYVAGLWVQAGALLATAVAVHFEGYGIPIGWLAIGVAAIELGRRLGSRGVSVYGLIVLGVATLRIFAFDSWANNALGQTIGTVGVLSISRWSLVAACAVIALHFAAFRAGTTRQGESILRTVLAVTGTVAWAVLWLCHDTGVVVTGAWVVGAVGLGLLARLGAPLYHDRQALALLFAATAKWILIDTLATRTEPTWVADAAPVLLTASVFCGLAVAAALLGAAVQLRRLSPASTLAQVRPDLSDTAASLSSVCLTLAFVTFGWTMSFEIERLLVLARESGAAAWPHPAAVIFAITMIWSLVGLLGTLVGRAMRDEPTERAGEVLALGAAGLWLLVGSVAVRIGHGSVDVAVLLNGQAAAALVAAATLVVLIALARRAPRPWLPTPLLWSAVGVIGLLAGSLEIDRWATHALADPDQARQVGFSVFWSLCGIGLVCTGFVRRRHLVRYAGLALLGVTLAKVLIVDTATIAATYRIASLLVVGLLLIVTSIAYFKLLPGRDDMDDSRSEVAA